ncbi:hypothetical protein [Stenotrophomonas sp. NPDC077659]|uniref:hypothetical protein n=1 Tax=Stenotrophomonas sp. NPDC077659 TaxID=3390694 RepID=UPI003D0785C8
MTPSQADAVATAVMHPDERRAEIAARQQAEAQKLQRQRRAVAIGMVGMVAGALIAYSSGLPWVKGLLYGGVPTLFIAQVWLERRALRG